MGALDTAPIQMTLEDSINVNWGAKRDCQHVHSTAWWWQQLICMMMATSKSCSAVDQHIVRQHHQSKNNPVAIVTVGGTQERPQSLALLPTAGHSMP